MINIIAIDNLRTLSFSAKFGYHLIFYFAFAGLMFFLPAALVTAELATRYPYRGGIYIWVEKAFGKSTAFFITLTQWIYNVIWFPTIMIFIWSIFTSITPIPILKTPIGTFIGVLTLFWSCTYANIFGMHISSRISSLGAIVGTILPMLLLMIGASISLYYSNDSLLNITTEPNHQDIYPYFVELVFGLIGIEMSAMHADEVDQPRIAFPRAILISSIIIFTSLVLGSLSVTTLVPYTHLSIITGTLQAITYIATKYNMAWLTILFGYLMILGSLATTAAWIIGPVKGLWAAANHGILPKKLAQTNAQGVPVLLLLLQASIYSVIVFLVLFFSIDTAFVLLSALTTQMALITYIVLFLAAIHLIKERPKTHTFFKAPCLKTVATMGICSSIGTLVLGFFIPNELNTGNETSYMATLIVAFMMLLLISALLSKHHKSQSA